MYAVNQSIPQQPVQPRPPIQNSNSNWLRILSIGLGVIGIGILIGITGYFLGTKKSQPPVQKMVSQPSPTLSPAEASVKASDPTATWKTYVGTNYGYSLRYPSNLEVVKSNLDNIIYVQTVGWTTEKANLADSYRIEITYLKDKVYSAEEYMNLDFNKIPPLPKPDFTQTTINGIPTIVKSYRDESYFAWGGNKQYYLYQGKKGIIFDGSGKNHKILDQILSTFKFTN